MKLLIQRVQQTSFENLGELQGNRLRIVNSVIRTEHRDKLRRSQVDHDRSYFPRAFLNESLGDISLGEVVPFQKFIALSEDVEGLEVVFGKEGDLEGASPIKNAAILENSLRSNQDAIDPVYVVSCFVVTDELASDTFQDELVVELRAQYHKKYPS